MFCANICLCVNYDLHQPGCSFQPNLIGSFLYQSHASRRITIVIDFVILLYAKRMGGLSSGFYSGQLAVLLKYNKWFVIFKCFGFMPGRGFEPLKRLTHGILSPTLLATQEPRQMRDIGIEPIQTLGHRFWADCIFHSANLVYGYSRN